MTSYPNLSYYTIWRNMQNGNLMLENHDDESFSHKNITLGQQRNQLSLTVCFNSIKSTFLMSALKSSS